MDGMCGRFALTAEAEAVAAQFGLADVPQLAPRYNIAPTQPVAAVRVNGRGARELTHFHWGLIPSWAKDTAMAGRMINARAETVAEKPSYRSPYKYRRCLLPVSGFYEWQKLGNGQKQPMYIQGIDEDGVVGGSLLGFAGIFEHWHSPDGSEIESVSVLTIHPNEMMAEIHNRMPVIIDPADYSTWLDPRNNGSDMLRHLLRPYPSQKMTAYPVSTLVNNARNDVAACIVPLA
jgi:putative SOS response-associated peptidase YedK